MSDDRRESSDAGQGEKAGRRWFVPNRSGVGWRPGAWQGWLILGLVIAALVTVVVLVRTGIL